MSTEQQLANLILLILPFSVEEVKEMEENCGTVWITLHSGKVYALTAQETEPEQLELDLK